jgi:Phosphatase
MPYDTLTEVRDALVAGGITGSHRSHPRRDNIAKIRALLDEDREAAFGLSGIERYSAAEILGFMSALTGCDADLGVLEGPDRIDPHRTVQALVDAGERLAAEASRGTKLLVATGHPTGLLEHHMRVADSYRKAGGKLLSPLEEQRFGSIYGRRGEVRYVGGVGCLGDGASLLHTHASWPMEELLEEEPHPELVLGDHGFAGAAIERNIPTIAVMDINDHALSIPPAENKDVVVVPLDDNRPPRLYEPSWVLLDRLVSGGSMSW